MVDGSMRRFLASCALLLALAPAAGGHEKHRRRAGSPDAPAPVQAQAPPPSSELDALRHHLRQPEYWHVLLNPLPSLAMGLAVILLAASLVTAAEGLATAGLVSIAIGGGAAFPVIQLGQRAYDRLFDGLPLDARLWLDVHMARAEKAQYLFYLAAIVAIFALARRKRQAQAKPLRLAALVLASASAVAAAWIAHAGGQVGHPEFRRGPPDARALSIVPRD